MTKFLLLDTETTGFDPGDHRFVELYFSIWTPAGKRVFEFNERVNPERSIPAEATRVHGITASDVAGCQPWSHFAPTVQRIMEKNDVFVAHNAEFDLNFLRYEFKRVGLELPERPVVDTMGEGIWATPDGKKPTLGELCFACGVDYDKAKAHAADYDVQVMSECFFKARGWGYFQTKDERSQTLAA